MHGSRTNAQGLGLRVSSCLGREGALASVLETPAKCEPPNCSPFLKGAPTSPCLASSIL